MDQDQDRELQAYPCRFPIKIMGRDNPGFQRVAVALVEQHTGEIDARAIRVTPSRNGNFTALTITIDATSRKQLDRIYRDLTDHDEVLIAL